MKEILTRTFPFNWGLGWIVKNVEIPKETKINIVAIRNKYSATTPLINPEKITKKMIKPKITKIKENIADLSHLRGSI